MLSLLKWSSRIIIGIIILCIMIFGGAYWLLSRSLPDYSEDFTLEGLSEPVEVIRDHSGVPHIIGQNDEDVFFALGFVHAQDRLWQMTMMRRAVQGRLSEIFGERTLEIDELMRRYALYDLARQSVKAQDNQTKKALQAYADGVNSWIKQVAKGGRGRGAPEFYLFSNQIAAWSPADSIAIIKLMALQLSGHLKAEVLRARLSLLLPNERLADIMPDAPGTPLAALPSYLSLMPDGLTTSLSHYTLTRPDDSDALFETLFRPPSNIDSAGASNAWAVAADHSAGRGTLLANDPHLEFTAPSIWYLARLELQSGGIIGATIPGMPTVILGRSDTLGWGLTSSYLDDQDIVLEKVNPNNADEYQSTNGWKRFKEAYSIISIKDAPPVTVKLQWSDAGPVLPQSYFDLSTITPPGHVAALSWSALSPDDTTMSASLAIMKAQNIDQALAATPLYIAPSQILLLADKNDIAFQLIGAMPMRDTKHPTKGRMPALGSDPATRWLGYFATSENPREISPKSGILGNTNNKISDQPFPKHVSYVWGDTERIQRLLSLMKARSVHTRESLIEAQQDTVSVAARKILARIGANLWFTKESAPKGTVENLRQRALALLASWNGDMNEHLPEPLISTAWINALQKRLIQDELGPLSNEINHPIPIFIERVFDNREGASIWCDIVQSEKTETCDEIAMLALDDALITLTERYGNNIEGWRWGNAHQATHDHPVLGNIPILDWFVNIRQSSSGGDFTLQRGLTKGTGDSPYSNVHGAGYRGIYDFSDPDASLFIISTGQSGNPFSAYYDNLNTRWGQSEYIPMSLDIELAKAASLGIMELKPLPSQN